MAVHIIKSTSWYRNQKERLWKSLERKEESAGVIVLDQLDVSMYVHISIEVSLKPYGNTMRNNWTC